MRIALAAVLLALTACAGSLEDPDRFGSPPAGGGADAGGGGGGGGGGVDAGLAACPDVEVEIFAGGCAGSICHDADQPAAGLDLASPGVAARLIDVASGCQDLPLLDSANPGTGYLLDKLAPMPQCGSQMPAGGQLQQSDIECIRAWAEEASQ